jgi:hypothetical protein
MSSSETVTLTIDAPPETETFIIDHRLQVAGRGSGSFQLELPPGIYKAKFRSGTRVVEDVEPRVLEPTGVATIITAPDLPVTSAAPLTGTGRTHEYHIAAASTLSRQVHVQVGHSAHIFVFARAWGGTGPPANPMAGLSLRAPDGSELADLEQAAVFDVTERDPWGGCCVQLDPGVYRLRLDIPGWTPLEQSVVACGGWQTQLFMMQRHYDDGTSSATRADLAGAAVLMARDGVGFDANGQQLVLTEAARLALKNRGGTLARRHVREMLWRKFENPMLGVYGAHALLLDSEPDLGLLDTVVTNLRTMLGMHPDVEATALALPDQAATRPFALPPMLYLSWARLLDHAPHDPGLVPPGSLSSEVGSSVWGEGPWLVWQLPSARAHDDMPASADMIDEFARLEQFAFDIVEGAAAPPATELPDMERAVLGYVRRVKEVQAGRAQAAATVEGETRSAASRKRAVRRLKEPPPEAPSSLPQHGEEAVQFVRRASALTPETIADRLGVPMSTLHTAVQSLMRKLPGS